MTPTDAQIKQVWEYSKEELAERLAIALCEIDRLTTAAGVGPDEKLIDRCKRLTKDRSEIEALTIERCAQWLRDNADYEGESMDHIAANMVHALKDKP